MFKEVILNSNNDVSDLRKELLKAELRSVINVIAAGLTIPLFLIFWIADIVYFPELKWQLLSIRLSIIPLCLLINHYARKINNYNYLQTLGAFYAISLASTINLMIYIIGDPSTAYYSGLNLISIGCLSFIPYTAGFYGLTTVGIYLPYYIVTLGFLSKSISDYKAIFINSFFVIGTIVICYVIRFFNERLRVKELLAQLSLKDEIKSREETIKQQTDEATRVNQLSAQFSPQVVKAIREGKIELDEQKLKHENICAIFIDIVRSTERVISLPESNVQKTLARFLDTVLTIFLKYDLTIDKFHGDGVLAFSNSPVKRIDFIERTCLAALEAKEALLQDTEFYLEHWGSEMQVRVGISAGYANVGFFGDKKYFKTFTAIGAPLPLASRLTSIANPDQILIDQAIAEILEIQNYKLSNLGEKILKGFEKETHIVYELLSSQQVGHGIEFTKSCPNHPNSILFLDTNDKGHFVFKCRECGYKESPEASMLSKAG